MAPTLAMHTRRELRDEDTLWLSPFTPPIYQSEQPPSNRGASEPFVFDDWVSLFNPDPLPKPEPVILNPASTKGYQQRPSGMWVKPNAFRERNCGAIMHLNSPFLEWRSAAPITYTPHMVSTPPSPTPEQIAAAEAANRVAEEAQRKAVEERRLADERATKLLREAGPEGEQLADGDAVIIPSLMFPDISYGIVPENYSKVIVFHVRLGNLGRVCIQAKKNAPAADVTLTRLTLCKCHEETLWRIGDFWEGADDNACFLPKQIRKWMDTTADNED